MRHRFEQELAKRDTVPSHEEFAVGPERLGEGLEAGKGN
jgi:hypothetical protein